VATRAPPCTRSLLLICRRTWSWRTSWTSCRWIVGLMLELAYEMAMVMELLSLFVSRERQTVQ
jgi:hypothetical protein